jgi:hypothetical protein
MARPLLMHKKHGERYAHPPGIESRIDVAVAQDLPTLRQRVLSNDRSSPEFLPSECLVHLIRNARHKNDQATLDALLPILLTRCEANLEAKIPDSLYSNAADLREEILSEFALLFAADGTGNNPHELDYFECKFNDAFRSLRSDMLRSERRRLKRIKPIPTFPNGEEGEVLERLSKEFHTAATHDHGLIHEELLKAINALPADQRDAVVLRYCMGMTEATAAAHCKVTGRMIRYRLQRAAKNLSQLQEDI